MNTVQKNNNITKSKMQEYINNNYKKLGLSEKNKDRIIKYIKLKKCTREIIKILYSQLSKIQESGSKQKGKHMVYEDRVVIEVLFNAGVPNTIISLILNKHRSSIGREINKGKIEKDDLKSTKSYKKPKAYKTIVTYSSSKANGICLINKSRCRKKYKLIKDAKLREIITKMIKGIKDEKTGVKIKYSPEAISNLLKEGKIACTNGKIATTTIYRAAMIGIFEFRIVDLPHGRHYYKQINEHAQYKEIKESKKEHSIEKMPEEVKKKQSITHFEGDTVVGKRDGTHNTLITLVNTSSKFLITERAKDKTAQSFVDVLNKLENEIPSLEKIMKTLLLDNGVEFSDIEGIKKSNKEENKKRLEVYYAHPYTSCERGCNENKNRDVRKDFPKGSLLEKLSDEEILNIARRINNTPRKILGWKTALEVFEEQLKSMNVDTKFLDKYRISKSKLFVA